jgi:hypothetical protein
VSAPKERAGTGADGQNARTVLAGTVTIINAGTDYIALEVIIVHMAGRGGSSYDGVFASCPDDGYEVLMLGPQDVMTCTWVATLPAGKTADMLAGLYR